MDYSFSEDMRSVRNILSLSQEELALQLGVKCVTVSRSETEATNPSAKLLEDLYAFAYKKGIRLNKLKEMFARETMHENHKLLFHGAKNRLNGPVSISCGRSNNDFGAGFYTGESYEQAVAFVAGYDGSSAYLIDFDPSGLSYQKYAVNRDWMLTIAYYRGGLKDYENHPLIQNLVAKSRKCDYIIAPIADNRMFQIINTFISGEITDAQCEHCLAATNLGFQYVFVSEQSLESIHIVDRCYLSSNEKSHFKDIRVSDSKLGEDKVKMARIKYRGQGRYIDEILK